MKAIALAASLIALAAPLLAAEDVDEAVARDLLTVITMQGLPCGEVVAAERATDQDYAVSCSSGDRYRVRIVEGRVLVERL